VNPAGAPVKDVNLKVVEMALKGMTPAQIAAAQDRPVKTIYDVLRRNVRKGVLPKSVERRNRLDYLKSKEWAGVSVGRLGTDILRALPDETVRWLVDQTPKGGTLADAIRGIVVDAYHER
jgi:hypothetical protein